MRFVMQSLQSTRESLISRFEQKLERIPESGCWIWMAGVDKDWYGKFRISKDSRESHIRANRASYLIYKGDIPDGMCVCHTCDVTACVNPDHLFLGTHKDNAVDREIKGRGASGSKNGNSVLTKSEAIAIFNDTRPSRKIAEFYGIGKTTVLNIKNKRTWIKYNNNNNDYTPRKTVHG